MTIRPVNTLLAAMLVTFVLGSVHAFSVFLAPLEILLQLPRSEVSLIYSFALVSITLAVTLGYRIYERLPAWWMVIVTGVVAAAGLCLAAVASDWWTLLAGYSLAFGLANGVGYGYCLQLVGRVLPARKGFAMGAVTAAYAVGSIVFAQVFAWRIAVDSAGSALAAIAFAVLVASLFAALVMYRAGASYSMPAASNGAAAGTAVQASWRLTGQFWLAYLCAVFAGLMAIGHAAGIAQALDADQQQAAWAAVTVGVGSAAGGFVSGGFVDRWPISRFLVGLPLLSAGALLGIGASADLVAALSLLAVVGFAYGAIIAIYPVAISICFGDGGARAYGRVFIGWGMAGLIAPWSAGLIFDNHGEYDLAMNIAAAVALLSAVCAALFRLGQPD